MPDPLNPPEYRSLTMRGKPHAGDTNPDLWKVLVNTYYTLRETAGSDAEDASKLLHQILTDPISSSSLVYALKQFKRFARDPVADLRARKGDTKKIAESIRIEQASQKIRTLPDKFLEYSDELKASVFALSYKDNVPTIEAVGKVQRETWHALRKALDEILILADEAQAIAPSKRGRQPDLRVPARERFAGKVYRAFKTHSNRSEDTIYWELFRALWFELTGDEEIPQEQKLREYLRDKK